MHVCMTEDRHVRKKTNSIEYLKICTEHQQS